MDNLNETSTEFNQSQNLNDMKTDKMDAVDSENFEYEESNENNLSLETILPNEEFDVNNSACTLPINQSPLEKLLQKQKMELAMELRRLQFANRPVSSTETRDRLDEFFKHSLHTDENNVSRPSNPNQFRTDNMRNEIESLGSQRRVSTILSTARQRLENTLRRIANLAATNRVQETPIQSVTNAVVASANLSQSSAYINGLQASNNSINSTQSSNSNIIIQAPNGSTNILAPVTAWVPLPITPAQNQTLNNNLNEENVIRQQTPAVLNTQPWLVSNADTFRNGIEQLRREQIIDEISELVHQQLVSSTLESQFRQRLEEHVMQQLQNTGRDTQRTREFIRNIPQTTHIERNDFSHLGIIPPTTANEAIADTLDSASTYQQEQRTQRVNNTRELRILQAEMKEMKNMMKLSFELQMDMQRSLRQEIAALIAGTLTDKTNESNIRTNFSTASNRPSNEGSCVVCTDGQVDTVFYKCGHMSTCYTCAMKLKQHGRNCPVCRAPIMDIIRAYRCNMD